MRAPTHRRLCSLTALATCAAALLLAPAAAQASTGPVWNLRTNANTTVAPGEQITYYLHTTNLGDQPTVPGACPGAQCETVEALFPAPLSVASAAPTYLNQLGWSCSVPDPHRALCTTESVAPAQRGIAQYPFLTVTAEAEAGAEPQDLAPLFYLRGGGGAEARTADPTAIALDPPGFGVDEFDGAANADAAGTPATQAGGHPYALTTHIGFNRATNPAKGAAPWPLEPGRDLFAALPAGLLGNPAAAPTCTASQLASSQGLYERPLCPPASQLGTATIVTNGGSNEADDTFGPLSLFNMVPPPGVPARFGFQFAGTVIVLDAVLRPGGGYAVSVASRGIPEALGVISTDLTFWGVPADPSHDALRGCSGALEPHNGGPSCPSEDAAAPKALLRLPTSCTGPLTTTLLADSWDHPGALGPEGLPDPSDPNWKEASFTSHDDAFPQPNPIGVEGCEAVPFAPAFSATPTSQEADSPSGLDVEISVPQQALGEPGDISQSDLKDARVVLPEGMRVNPSVAAAVDACTSAQVGLGSSAPVTCPPSSKLGSVEIESPLLAERDGEGKVIESPGGEAALRPLHGAVYLAAQGDNPFNSLLALYLVIEDAQSGVNLKLPGKVIANPESGRLETVFSNQPQLPFSHLRLHLTSGTRAPLRTPPACGQFTTEATLTPWSGNAAVSKDSSFEITSGPGGSPCPSGAFAPKLSAGTVNPIAATYSPFVLRLTREDGTRELTGLTATLPPGLIGKLAGVAECPDATIAAIPTAEGTGAAQLASPSCPAASQVGTVTAGAGAGTNPFYVTTGRAYLAGPYKGAPLSLAIVTPALAGPFDLGNVVVRTALNVNPETTQITAVSDPIPTILQGIPLDIRSLEVNMNRPDFTLNPTSCDEMRITGTATGVGGTSAPLSDRFQVGNCAALAFKPKLTLSAKGGTKRSQFPAFSATLKMPSGGANIAAAAVTLPAALQIENAHIQQPCTRVQFAESACPAKSILGHARAFSPLLDQPLEGPVYFRSNGGEHLLPDIVADLRGQIHVVLVGHVDAITKHGVTRIRNSFETVPDAPVSKFTLSLFGGKRGYLVNNRDVCNSANRADVKFDAQNGKIADSTVTVANSCKKKHGAKKHRSAHR